MKTRCSLLAFLMVCVWSVAATGQERPLPRTMIHTTEVNIRRATIQKVDPTYPVEAREAGIEGLVLVFIWFDSTGALVEAKPLISPNKMLSDAVVNALNDWRIKPFNTVNPDWDYGSELRFVFSLKDGKATVSEAPAKDQEVFSREMNAETYRRYHGKPLPATPKP